MRSARGLLLGPVATSSSSRRTRRAGLGAAVTCGGDAADGRGIQSALRINTAAEASGTTYGTARTLLTAQAAETAGQAHARE